MRLAVAAMARTDARAGSSLSSRGSRPRATRLRAEPWIEVVEEAERKVVVMETSTLAERVWVQDKHWLVWTHQGIEHLHECGESGAFTRDDNLQASQAAGLEVEHDLVGLIGRGLFIGRA